MLGSVSPRELALATWLVVFMVWCLSQTSIRQSLAGLVGAAVQPILVTLVGLIFAYTAAAVWLLARLDLWELSQFKTTLIWAAFIAIASAGEAIARKDDPRFLWNAFRDNLKLVVLIEFIVSLYTFSYLVELIVLPIVTIIATMAAMAEREPAHRIVAVVFNNLLAALGLALIVYSAWMVVHHFGDVATLDNLRELYTPPLLSLLFLPFLFILKTYSAYELAFNALRFVIKDRALRRHAEWSAVRAFALDVEALRRWTRGVQAHDSPSNRSDIRRSIAEVKTLRRRERTPPVIAASDGWSPYIARHYLSEHGLPAQDYHRLYDEWFAASHPIEIGGNGFMPDNMAYYIEGDEHVARQLRVKLNVNTPEKSAASEEALAQVASALAAKAIEAEHMSRAQELVRAGKGSVTIEGRKMSVVTDPFPSGRGYSVTFLVETASPAP